MTTYSYSHFSERRGREKEEEEGREGQRRGSKHYLG